MDWIALGPEKWTHTMVSNFTVAVESVSSVADVARAVIRSYIVAACCMFTADMQRRGTFVDVFTQPNNRKQPHCFTAVSKHRG